MKQEKLKTLKEMENGFKVVGIRELKAEAIKHIQQKQMSPETTDWIMDFFNLNPSDIEEDLKNGG